MVLPPISKVLARGSHHPRAQASLGRTFVAPKLSMVADTCVGTLSFVGWLSSAFIPQAIPARSLADYTKGGAVILYDATASLQLLLTAEQNHHFFGIIEQGVCRIEALRS